MGNTKIDGTIRQVASTVTSGECESMLRCTTTCGFAVHVLIVAGARIKYNWWSCTFAMGVNLTWVNKHLYYVLDSRE